MSQQHPAPSAFELHGAATDMIYSPAERLEVRDSAGTHVYPAHSLVVEPVSLGHLVTVPGGGERQSPLWLLLSKVPRGGGPVSAIAISVSEGSGWSTVAMQGQAGADATRATRAAAVRSVSTPSPADAPKGQGVGSRVAGVVSAAAGTVSVNVAADKFLASDAGDAAVAGPHAGDDVSIPDDGVTTYTHWGSDSPAEDETPESDSEDEQEPDSADGDFFDGFGGGPHLPHDLI